MGPDRLELGVWLIASLSALVALAAFVIAHRVGYLGA
jgi:hypothetical protein